MVTTDVIVFLLMLIALVQDSATEVIIATNGNWNEFSSFDYGIDIRGTDHLYFRVKCCYDALMRLYASFINPSGTALIHMGIFNNAKCHIKPCTTCEQRYTEDYPFLNCNELRPFWVSWKNGVLKLGQGHLVDQHLMVEATQQMGFTPQYMSVASGYHATAVWEIRGNYQINPPPCGPLNFHLHDVNSKVTKPVIHTFTKPTPLDCVMECRLLRMCRSANYRSSDQTCDIFNTVPLTEEMMADSDWQLWIAE